MVSTFGDIVYESSRAFADDEEEEFQNQSLLSFELEHTTAGESLQGQEGASLAATNLVFCSFVGKVALGFGDGFLSSDRDFELLAQAFMVGQGDNVVDMYLNRPKKKVVARIFLSTKDKNSPILFALFNTYGVPRYLANEVVESVAPYINICSRLLIFHSDTMAYYQGDESCEGKVFHVVSSQYLKDEIPPISLPLTPPNVIGGVSAAVLLHGEMTDKPSMLLATYSESELVDSISLQPFANAIKQGSLKKEWGVSKVFEQLHLSSKTFKTNINPVAISNLYI